MGNHHSWLTCGHRKRRPKQLGKFLSPRQIQLVQCTWSILKLDLAALGVSVFSNFLETEPELKMMFPKMARMNDRNQLEWDIDLEMLQKHAMTVMEGLGAAVETLYDSYLLNRVLIALGQTHWNRNVKPNMLKRMWPSVHKALGSALGDGYTVEVSEAWLKLYQYLCIQMRIGMEHPELLVDIQPPLPAA